MWEALNIVAGLVAFSYFVSISIATRQHFSSEKYPLGMYLISALSIVGLYLFMRFAFVFALNNFAVSAALILIAFALFFWALKHSRAKKLSLAFDEETRIDGIIVSGPWKYVRHPFYVSYVLFWLGCALGTLHLASITVAAALLFIYAYSAAREEAALKLGRYGGDYVEYRKRAGFFLPRITSRN